MTEVKHQRRIVTKSLALISCAMLFALCFPAEAQQPKKVYRIGFLSEGSPSSGSLVGLAQLSGSRPFLQGLRELGYVEGKNIVIEYRYAEGKSDRLPNLATELVRKRVDVILATSTAAAQAAKKT